MKSIINLSNKPIIRNVAIVATGTAAAQVATMAFAPIITRIYGPEQFGILGVFMAMVAIVAPIAALTYPIAIVLPKNDVDAKALIRLSIYVAVIMSMTVSLILFFFNKPIVSLMQIEAIAPFLYLIPLVILFSALLQVSQQWLIRNKQFRVTAKVTFLNALILNSAKVGFGWLNPVAATLVILATLGSALHALMLIIGSNKGIINKQKKLINEIGVKVTPIKEVAKTYRDFPIFRAPQVFINAISQSLPILLLASFFGPASAGFYSIVKSVLSIPIGLVSKSVGDVLYPRFAVATNNDEKLTSMLIKSTLALAAVGILPFGIVIAFGPWIFGFVFGADWTTAGEYARWLALWIYFMFINRPSVTAIPVLSLQGKFLFFEIFSILSKIIALLIGFYIFGNDVFAIALYSLVGVIAYLYLIIWVINSSNKS